MSDVFSEDLFPQPDEPRDPLSAARDATRPALPKRFYKTAATEERDGGFVLTLDGRPARTPGRRPLAAPTRALGEAIAAEWQAQGEQIDPGTMPIVRIANSAIDGVAASKEAVIDDLVRYAGSDLVCYRAGDPERLVAMQSAAWDPILAWARDEIGARFVLSEGVMHVRQPEEALATFRRAVEADRSEFVLAGLHVMTTLSGSALIALAHLRGALTREEAWEAAHVDEVYQESIWGTDAEALARRLVRRAEFEAASTIVRLGSIRLF